MTTVTAYEAKTHLPRLIRAVERGETVIITRYGKPVAKLAPVEDHRRKNIAEVMERMAALRRRLPKVSIEEILARPGPGPQILMALVVDASVALGWYFPDEITPTAEAARRHLSTTDAAVPALWWFEVRNALIVGERRGRMDATQVAEIVAQLGALPIHGWRRL